MQLLTEPYLLQYEKWPKSGQRILGQHNEDSIVVYQAYNPAIGHFAAQNQFFGGNFKLDRMSWIKTSFMWMMYRSGWGTKLNQEVTLAIWLKKEAFHTILNHIVHAVYISDLYGNRDTWQKAIANSLVRLQWDPDHDPQGSKLERRAIQLGLKGAILEKYSKDWILEIQDISTFVAQQRVHVNNRNYGELETPIETLYPIDTELATALGISDYKEWSITSDDVNEEDAHEEED